ncbi:hypothetical protein JOF56_003899 [Kibdelosporangium banguiense]|uniref:Uncharacterized protein n=1 Tax=Kibdelosporangium banguiense TaxID=1365924 RepID=A0ABS4THN2_9PSEU|nr:hypothetical protein [Kibdelosporangium banguiense]MBP2323514.1 hypothetical protein [Kibdelosporangium banguiense]
MSKYWLHAAGLATALGISLLCVAGPGHAAPVSQGHADEVALVPESDATASPAALLEADCGNFKIDKPWGSAEGTVCWKGGRSKGKVLDKKDDGKCVWVRLWYTMEDGSTKMLDSPKACGKDKAVSVANSSPKKSVAVRGSLMKG